jgi:hypothetical protein
LRSETTPSQVGSLLPDTSGPNPNPGDAHEALITDWDQPLGPDAATVASVDEAASSIKAFTMHAPKVPGVLKGIVLNDDALPREEVVVFVYDTVAFGRVWIIESLPDIEDDKERLALYQSYVSRNGTAYVKSEIVTVGADPNALVWTSPDPKIRPTRVSGWKMACSFRFSVRRSPVRMLSHSRVRSDSF